MTETQSRRALFAACKRLGMDDGDRHAMLQAVIGKASSKDLTPREWSRVLDHLNRLDSTRPANEWAWVDTSAADRQPLLKKLIMLAKSAGIARGGQIRYLEGIAKQSSGLAHSGVVKPLRLCGTTELRTLVQIMGVHIKRQAKQNGSPDAAQRNPGTSDGSRQP